MSAKQSSDSKAFSTEKSNEFDTQQRYLRQTMLKEVGVNGQQKLFNSHVLVIGAGGLAAPLLLYLVGAGVGKITVVDHDRVSLSNLHRQVIFRESDIGQFKVDAAQAHLQALNPHCHVIAHRLALSPANAQEFINKADIVIDCADSFAVSYILSDACLQLHKTFISASVTGFEGYVGSFCGGAPSLRAIFPNLPMQVKSCQNDGVLGSVVAVIASLQTQMVMSALLQNDDITPITGKLLTFNGKTFHQGMLGFSSAQEPKTFLPFIDLSDVSAADKVIELRSKEETPQAITDNAMRLSVDDIDEFISSFTSEKRMVICCQSGLRAWRFAEKLQDKIDRPIVLLAASASSMSK